MPKKPSSSEVKMFALNIDVPEEMAHRIKLAKVLLNTSVRQIAAEAFEAWLKSHGITPDKVDKLRGK